ncbi:hypothetical protein BJF79_03400 [Actinomadura sp. CNU-125]|uniref:hypothetical protein n=1 Tax=Actinomadura sp. CNU-125 TaxID=1904961 RepID=UPI00095D2903|nr:hypothetical protein [Actinomadura sp. CNU-125]OLT12959.1 hypothetical protein BJF79_03400 [Actinomadura sp. CNU-125]
MFFLSIALDAITTPILTAAARFRRHTPPWECDHRWKVRLPVVTGTAARSCTRCTVLEPLRETQPALHPESLAIRLPVREEAAFRSLAAAFGPGEYP